MNQAQRKFLIEKIETNVKARTDELKHSNIEQPPSLENYFYGLALSGKLEIQPQEHIKKVMSDRAMKHSADRYNSMEDNSNCGIEEEWTTEEAINQFIAHAQNSWGFIETPELIVN